MPTAEVVGNFLPDHTRTDDDYSGSEPQGSLSVAPHNETSVLSEDTAAQGKKITTTSASSSNGVAVHRWVALWTSFHLMLHMLWLQATLFFGRFYISFVGGEISNFNRKLVVIGDDSALGVGDWVTLLSYPGVHRRLNEVINLDTMTRPIGRGVMWNAYDGGRSASMSSDWLPECEMTRELVNLKRKWRLIGTRNLFDSLFDPNVGEHRNADIVIVMLGQHDRCNPQETKLNIIKICVELMKRNKYVIVCAVPNYPYLLGTGNGSPSARPSPNAPKLLAEWKARNEALRDAVKYIQTNVVEFAKERHGMVEFSNIVERPLPYNYFRFNGRFLSGRGFDTITKDLLEQLRPMMRRVDKDKAIPKATATYSHFR